MTNKIIAIGLSISTATILMAEPNIPRGDFGAKLEKVAGEQGQFYKGKENFPKDYFLVPDNLPFLAGLSLHHPESSNLNLSDKQIKAIQEIKKRTVLPVIKASKDIKILELKLAQNIGIDTNTAKSQYEIVDAIGKLRIDLTKAHLQCINDVRAVLTGEQYKELLKYATKLGYKYKKTPPNELISMPHPDKWVRGGVIKVTDEQRALIGEKVKAVYPVTFKPLLEKAKILELEVSRMIADGKNSADMQSQLDEIALLQRKAADGRIDGIVQIKKIFDPKQWQQLMKLTYKNSLKIDKK